MKGTEESKKVIILSKEIEELVYRDGNEESERTHNKSTVHNIR